MNPASDLVNKLWRLCTLLRKDGITYQQYVTELTYLLFLKMESEQKDESRIPEQYRWRAITAARPENEPPTTVAVGLYTDWIDAAAIDGSS